MKHIPLARFSAFSPFPHGLTSGGFESELLFEQLGMPTESITDPEILLPLEHAGVFIEEARKRTGHDQLGLLVGSQGRLSTLGTFGKIMKQSISLKHLLEQMVYYLPAANTAVRATLTQSPNPESIRFTYKQPNVTARAEIDAYSIIMLIDGIQMAAGKDWKPDYIALDRSVGSLDEFELFSEAKHERNVDYFAFDIPKRLLPKRLTITSPIPSGASHAYPQKDLKHNLIGSILAAIRYYLPVRILTINEAAHLLGVSKRTLQYRLSQEAVSFRTLVQKVQYDRSLELISDLSLELKEIAQEVGYRDASNFTHAFRGWTGMSPTEYIRTQLDDSE